MAVYTGGNTTGFASPAGDHLEDTIDLTELLSLRQPSRYPIRVSGDALSGRGIRENDILIADSAQTPAHGRLAIVMIGGDVLVGELAQRGDGWWLVSGLAQGTPELQITEEAEIWGMVTGLVRAEV